MRRARSYLLLGSTLWRQYADGRRLQVPGPGERRALILKMHNQTGHFGERRTLSMLRNTYWWYGMAKDTTQALAQCEVCDRVKASFDKPGAQLNPLPISGLFYRWGFDLCGPFPKTADGNT